MGSPDQHADRGARGLLALLGGVALRAVQGYADGGPHLAGAIAFRVLFSVFPLVIVLAGAFAIVVDVTGLRADVVDAVVRNAPLTDDGQRELRGLLEGATGGLGGLGLLGILGLVWSASGMMGAIRYALNTAWGADDGRPFLRGKLVDLLLVLGVGALVGLSLFTAIAARVTSRYAHAWLDSVGLGGAATWAVGLVGSTVLAWAAVAVLFQTVPSRRTPWRSNVVVAGVVGLVLAALQSLYGVYLGSFANYNAIYGSLGAIVAFLFYVYLAASVLVLGARGAAAVPAVRAEVARGGDPGRASRSDDGSARPWSACGWSPAGRRRSRTGSGESATSARRRGRGGRQQQAHRQHADRRARPGGARGDVRSTLPRCSPRSSSSPC
ncbi:MAG: YihY/virulence factor BrkB family protein [Thermoleophilia bacterium]